MKNSKISRREIFYKFSTMIITGLASFLLSFFIMINIFGIHSLDQVVSFLLKLTTDNDVEFKSNSLILILLMIFLLGYLVFTFSMVGIETFSWMKKDTYVSNRVRYQKKFYGILTFGVVLFGFIPVIIAFFDEVEEVKNSAVTYFITMSLLLLYPYLYFARAEGNVENELNTEQLISLEIWKIIRGFVSFFQLRIRKDNRHKQPFILLLVGTLLLVLSLIITLVFFTITKLVVLR